MSSSQSIHFASEDPASRFAAQVLYDSSGNRPALSSAPDCHPDRPPKYICSQCRAVFCGNCAAPIGSSGKAVCGSCDSLCFGFAEVQSALLLLRDQQAWFGLADLSLAAMYPLRQGLTCIGLGVIYGATLFSLPFFNIAYAGLLLGAIGLVPAFIGNSLMFGCALRVVEHAQAGRTDRGEVFDVLPLLADVWETARLGGAILISLSWVYVVAWRLSSNLELSLLLTTAWVFAIYPAVLAVAAITRGFWPTVNPVLVLSMMVRMRAAYWRLFIFYFPVSVITSAVVGTAAWILIPAGINMPIYLLFGIFAGSIVFYANMVVAFLTGRALFKFDGSL